MEYKMLINGELVDAEKKEFLEAINPATGKVIAKFPKATKADAKKAITAARTVFDKGDWPGLTFPERAEYLKAIANSIKENISELAQLEAQDAGKTIKETSFIDIAQAAYTFEYFAGAAEAVVSGETINIPGPNFCFTQREPRGVVGAITAFNYPLLFAAWKIAPAIITGNCVVLKPSSLTSLTTLELAKLIQKCELPKGVVNIITGKGTEAGQELIDSVDVDMITFTGSAFVGKSIVKDSSSTLKKLLLELGGKSANIVLADCDFEAAVGGALTSIFMNQGQMCTAGSRLLLDEKIYDKFLDALVSRAKKIKLGDTLNPDTQMGPLISKEQQGIVAGFVNRAQKEGAKVLCGGETPKNSELKNGFFFEPTIISEVKPEMEIFQEEIFGPVLTVTKFKNEKEAIELANNSKYGLAAMIWTNNLKKAQNLSSQIQAGTIWVNTYGAFSPQVSFGGYKQSGLGRELGREGLLEYTQVKAVNMDTSEGKPLISHWFSV